MGILQTLCKGISIYNDLMFNSFLLRRCLLSFNPIVHHVWTIIYTIRMKQEEKLNLHQIWSIDTKVYEQTQCGRCSLHCTIVLNNTFLSRQDETKTFAHKTDIKTDNPTRAMSTNSMTMSRKTMNKTITNFIIGKIKNTHKYNNSCTKSYASLDRSNFPS